MKKSKLGKWLQSEMDTWTQIGQMKDELGYQEKPTEPRRISSLASAELRVFGRVYPLLAVILCIVMSAILILTVSHLPRYGEETAPANNEVAERYLEQGMEETGAVNSVAGMIISYRGFDTLGEAHVLFTAVVAVMILLMEESDARRRRAERREEALLDLSRDPIVRQIVRFLVPTILLFGIYIMLNGHLSPGGGFSGGAIVGAALILHSLGYGFERTERLFSEKVYAAIKVSALLLYALLMGYFFFTGANGLNAHIPLGTPGDILSAGFILPINIAVGFEVACTMYGLYSFFRRGRI